MPLLLSLAVLAAPFAPPVTALAYRPDGSLLAAGGRGTVHLIDPATGTETATLPGQTGRVTGLAFSTAGVLAVASGEPGRSGVVRLYAPGSDGKLAAAGEIAAHADIVYAVAFSPDGKTLATAGYDRLVKLWDVPAATAKPRLTLADHSDAVYAVSFHPSGKLLASAAADRAVKVWDVATGKRLYTLSEPTDWLYAVAWSPDGTHLAAGGADKGVRVWAADAAGGKLTRFAFAHEGTVSHVLWGPGGKTLVTVGEDRRAKLWDAATLTVSRRFAAEPDAVLSAALRPDGKQFAVGRFDGAARLFDVATGNPTAQPLPAKPKPPKVSKLTPNAAPRGTTVRVAADGEGLDGDLTVTVSAGEGLAAQHLTPVRSDGGQIEFDLPVPTAIPPGPLSVVVTRKGDKPAEPVRFWADRFPAVAEPAAGGKLALPATVAGQLDRVGQVDEFRFDAAAGQQVGVQLQTAADRGKFDPVLALTDADGRTVATGRDGVLGYIAAAAGTYTLTVRDREYRGGAELAYRLHVGPVPVATGVFPPGVTRGVETAVRVTGVNLGPAAGRAVTVSPPADAAPGTRLPVGPKGVPAHELAGSPSVVVGEFPAVTVTDKAATLPAVPGTADGLLAAPGESQLIRFPAKKGERLLIEVHAERIGSPVDSAVEVVDAAGKAVPQAVLRSTARVYVAFRDHDASKPGIRLETWHELGVDDLMFLDGEVMRIKALPRNPDDDCQFYEVGGKRVGLLGTTPSHHALGSPMYRVEVHPPGATFPPAGLPVFRLDYRNDDGGPGFGKDSRLFFDPPADGTYAIRVADATGSGGPLHAFRLTVRRPRPDFSVKLNPTAPAVWKGGAVPVTVSVDRTDGFDGPVAVRLDGLTPPFTAPPTVVEAGQSAAVFPLSAGPEPVAGKVPAARAVATATIDGREVVHEARFDPPTVHNDAGFLGVSLATPEVVIRPGGEARVVVRVDRRNGFAGRVPVDVRGLPHGVRVLDVGLNGILVTPTQAEREVVLAADPWVKPQARPFAAVARHEKSGGEHAAPGLLRVAE